MEEPQSAWKFDETIHSTLGLASDVVRRLVEQLNEFKWIEKDLFAVHMAFEEAIMNAVKHGNSGDEHKSIKVLIHLDTNDFYARIEDEGDGFNPENVPDPCDNENLDKTSGRGVSLIKNFVDEVSYNERGNVIEIRKRSNAKTKESL